uniref:Solute carrier family 44 member 5 n=1 Tax=Rousettus aegyptiacus TaxID=9407 RepID=A0A7J8KGU1_ROUAE|nr:solute carrier family 44 member 5 [Rousettus aegyptiacus]
MRGQPPDTYSEDKKYGNPRTFDPNFKGPVANRNCTDILCCIIFMLFIIGYILLGLIAWVHGDPRKVVFPTDSEGHFCGQKGTPTENKSILFYFNLFSCTSPSVMVNLQCPTTQICVSKCPEKFLTYVGTQFPYRKDKGSWTYFSQFCKSSFAKPEKVCVFKFKTQEEFNFCFNLRCNINICNWKSSQVFYEIITEDTISLKPVHKCACMYKTHTPCIACYFVVLECYARLLSLVS